MEELVYDKIEVSYEVNYDDNKTLQRKPAKILLILWLIFTTILITIFILTILYGTQKVNLFGISVLIFLSFFLMIFFQLYFKNPGRTWEQQKDVPKDRDVVVLLDCIEVKSPHLNYECSWDWVLSINEHKEIYVINNLYNPIIIPKRALSEREEEMFRKIAMMKLPPKKVKFKKRKLNSR